MIQSSNDKMKITTHNDWKSHIKLVHQNEHKIVQERNADIEIIDLEAILDYVARATEV